MGGMSKEGVLMTGGHNSQEHTQYSKVSREHMDHARSHVLTLLVLIMPLGAKVYCYSGQSIYSRDAVV